jgi:hypothetical protein
MLDSKQHDCAVGASSESTSRQWNSSLDHCASTFPGIIPDMPESVARNQLELENVASDLFETSKTYGTRYLTQERITFHNRLLYFNHDSSNM